MSAHKWEHVGKCVAHGRWSGTCGPPVFSITADMSQGRYMFPAAASAHALPGKEEVLSWKKLAIKLVFSPLIFLFPFWFLALFCPSRRQRWNSTAPAVRDQCVLENEKSLSAFGLPHSIHFPPEPTTGHYSCMMAHLLPINCVPVDLRAHKTSTVH